MIPAQRTESTPALVALKVTTAVARWVFAECGYPLPAPAVVSRFQAHADDIGRRHAGDQGAQYDAMYALAAAMMRPFPDHLQALGEHYRGFLEREREARAALERIALPSYRAPAGRTVAEVRRETRRGLDETRERLAIMKTGMIETVRFLVGADVLDRGQAAEIAGISPATVRAWLLL